MYKYIAVLAILFVVVYSAPQTRKRTATPTLRKCANETVLENCLQQLLMIGGPEKHFPQNTEQITAFCGKLKESDACVKDYTRRCMTPTGKIATEVAIAGIARMTKSMCKSSTKKQEFVKSAKCGNAVIGDMRSCLNDYKMALYGATKAPLSGRLPILCCKFYDFRGCVRNGYERVGSSLCPEESQAYYTRIADSFQSDFFELICNEYDDGSDKCKNVPVPKVIPSDRTRPLFSPLREVIKSIMEEQHKE